MGQLPLPAERDAAEGAQEAGYTTALIGKWGLGEPDSTGMPNRQGFDYFFGYLCQRHAHNYYPEFLFRNDERVPLEEQRRRAAGATARASATERVEYSHDLMDAGGAQFVEQNKDRAVLPVSGRDAPARQQRRAGNATAWRCRTTAPTPTRIGPSRRRATPP